jgi:hypothetical protein
VDSDLYEALGALKQSLNHRGKAPKFGRCDPELVKELKASLKLPRRYRDFLLEADPLNVETRTPSECVRLIGSAQLLAEQQGFAPNGWRPGWVVVAHSTLLGDPYFLDTALPDAEGDCPVYTAMSGTDQWKPRLCASSFALFIRILALGMEVAEGFADENLDFEDETLFREALGPKLRQHDPAALKAGHWT